MKDGLSIYFSYTFKLSKIVNLADNIALRLAASRVRIVAPIPGKQAVGIEIPNKKRSIVSINELLMSDQFNESKYEIPIALGKDITGDIQIIEVSGIVRPNDIAFNNTVRSEQVANFNIVSRNKGVSAPFNKPGWLGRIFDILWPF